MPVFMAGKTIGTDQRPFTGNIAIGPGSDHTARQIIRFIVGHPGQAGQAELHRGRIAVTGDGGIGIGPFNNNRRRKAG